MKKNIVKVKYALNCRVDLVVEQANGVNTSKQMSCDVIFNCPDQREFNHLRFSNKKPTDAGLRASTTVLISGLAANINYGTQQNFWDRENHLQFIIAELQRQYDQTTNQPTPEPKMLIERP